MAPKKLTCPTLNNKLSGSYAALLTPFDPKGKVDYETFEGVMTLCYDFPRRTEKIWEAP